MICSKCGAPIPAGMHACPYCGASGGIAPSHQTLDEETSFAEVDEGEFRSREDDKTEFADDAWQPATPAEEETEYVQEPVQPTRRPAPAPRKKAPEKKAAPHREKRPRKEKQPRPPRNKEQPESGEAGHNNVLRIVLVAVLAVLIVLLILRG